MNYLNRSFQAVFTAYSDSIILKEKISVKTEGAIPWNPDFLNLPRGTKIGLKNRVVREIGSKIKMFD